MKFWSHKTLLLIYLAVYVTAALTAVITIGCVKPKPHYPKYHLAQQVKVEGCVGVITKAYQITGGNWGYEVVFELKCPSCETIPNFMTKVHVQCFNESSLSPADQVKAEAPPEIPEPKFGGP